MKDFGKTLRKLIAARKMTNKQFAAIANVGEDLLYRNLRSPHPVSRSVAYFLIADGLGMTEAELDHEWKDAPASGASNNPVEENTMSSKIGELASTFRDLPPVDREALYALLAVYVAHDQNPGSAPPARNSRKPA